MEQAKKLEEPNVKIFRHAQFEVNPKYSDLATFGGTFQIVVGNDEQATRPRGRYPFPLNSAKNDAGSVPSARQT